ncbi:dnaJ homolog subfamily C member 21-like [Condylostylus longicornis]|uniref:dnaJ homolog subfamily C member 21-like n=1 Tax=Condylostylus longicornis TaxID=2530218 RepID=UPI00244DEC3A|nr:dnaJ homolog subfamily C member 21-like [Condylostylus longicornis]
MKRCLYEVLGVDQHAPEDDIRKSYRRLALKFHPDKNPGDEEARVQFLAVQEAYETLSDPNERAWYDGHRVQILRGDDAGTSGDDPSAERINIFRWFRKDCFDGFSESVENERKSKCFFTVYREVFDIIADEEVKRTENPKGSSCEEFKTAPTHFGFAEEWNLAEAPNRFVRRQMEAENKKKRKDARKEFNDSVRALLEFVKKRDPRLAAVRIEKANEARRVAEEKARKKIEEEEERRCMREAAVEEEMRRWEELEKEKAASTGQVFLDEAWQSESDVEEGKGKKKNKKKTDNIMYACEACKKAFRSEAQFKSHEKSKKHIIALNKFLEELEDDAVSSASPQNSDGEREGDFSDSQPDKLELESQSENSNSRRNSSGKSDCEKSDISSSDSEALDRLLRMRMRKNYESESEAESTDSSQEETEAAETKEEEESHAAAETKEQEAQPAEAKQEEIAEQEEVAEQKAQKISAEAPQKVTLKAKKQNLKAAGRERPSERPERCTSCNKEFMSRNQLFKHIRDTGHAAIKDAAHSKQKQKKKGNS